MKRLKIYQTVQPTGDTPFGEQVNLYTGELTFRQPDIVLEGTGPTISLTRYTQGAQANDFVIKPAAAGGWHLSIPRIETLTSGGWVIGPESDPNRYARCTKFNRPYQKIPLTTEWWTGMEMTTEEGNRQPILKRAPLNTLQPAMLLNGQPMVFPAVTQQNWQIGCLPATSNGVAGEAFLVVSPNGTKYWFDRLVYELAEKFYEYDNISGEAIKVPRTLATMYVTRIEDRFGNFLTYQYNGDKLASISASDGRVVSLQWRGDSPVVDTITVQPGPKQRVWKYAYSQADALQANLSAVVLPDQSRWSFGQVSGSGSLSSTELSKCTTRTLPHQVGGNAFTITHPSGLVGEFTLTGTWHARSYVPSYCHYPQGFQQFEPYEDTPPLFGTVSLTRKTFSGPGLSAKTWEYRYPVAQGSTTTDPCAAMQTCPDTVWTDVVDPTGNRTRYTHSNRFDETEGKLRRTEVYQGEATLLRTETFAYAAGNGGPYPISLGGSLVGGNYNAAKDRTTPLKQRDIAQQGVIFTWKANSFDQYASPLSETRSNTMGYQRGSSFAYHHAPNLWVIGQLAKTTCTAPVACIGQVEREIVYDGLALPQATYAFGKWQGSRQYHADGTLATATDANGHATVFANWKRGIPQRIVFADGTSKSATVNDHGQIDSVTDENGYTTKYGYDAIGRLNLIDYPDGDSVNWTSTLRSFVQVQAAEYGIPAGHWRQTVGTGNGYQVTYFDARWQPVLTREYDAGNVAATQRFVGRSFDHAGRETFVAYPLAAAPNYPIWNGLKGEETDALADAPPLCHPQPDCQPGPDPNPDPDPNPNPNPIPPPAPQGLGIRTAYDALGRVVAVKQDSELGVLTTLSQYLDGLQTRVTNPRGFQTTTRYMAYDRPTAEWPRYIAHPEGAYTDISRDPYGKPLSLARHNADNSQWNPRYYAYDAHQRLCKQSEPETGTTAFGYDEAGNLTWSATGLPWSPHAPCDYTIDHALVVPKRVDRTYDKRSRLQTLRHPDGLGDQDWQYTPDGLPQQVTAYNGPGQTLPVVTAYAYNKRRLLNGQGEVVSQPNAYAWGIGYAYDANGHLARQSHPTGLVIHYTPNALGQPTSVISPGQNYATGISYHPNGAIKQFTYGNGLTHIMTQNLRQLPETSCDFYTSCPVTSILNDSYDYDFNGNVAAISDGVGAHRGNRTMTYDGLDRLKTVVSPMFAQASYSYDVLDNLTRAKIDGSTGKRDHYYCFDAQQHLTNVKVGGCNGVSVIGLGYDERGNLANKNGQAFEYDFGNRLRNVPGKESYRYDGLGRRVEAIKPNQDRHLWQYSRAGQLMYAETAGTQIIANEYVYLGGSLIATRERNWLTNVTAIKYIHTDSLGSPIAYTDKNRVLIEKNEFEPYGLEINGVTKDGPNYTRHVADTATGMINMQQRYYDPYVPKFNSRDSAPADEATNFNAYRYGAGNPYRFTDPDGRRPQMRGGPCGWCDTFMASDGGAEYPSHQYEKGDITVVYRYNAVPSFQSYSFPEYNKYLRWKDEAGVLISMVVDRLNEVSWKGTPYKVPVFLELADLKQLGVPKEFRYIANATGVGFSKAIVVNGPAFMRRDPATQRKVTRHEYAHTTIYNEVLRRMWNGVNSNRLPPHEIDAYEKEVE